MAVDELIHFRPSAPPVPVDDLAPVPSETRHLSLFGRTKNLLRRSELPMLEALWIEEFKSPDSNRSFRASTRSFCTFPACVRPISAPWETWRGSRVWRTTETPGSRTWHEEYGAPSPRPRSTPSVHGNGKAKAHLGAAQGPGKAGPVRSQVSRPPGGVSNGVKVRPPLHPDRPDDCEHLG